MITQHKRLAGIITTVVLILMIPVVAKMLNPSFPWTAADYIGVGILLMGTGLLCEMVLRNVKTLRRRLFILGVILFGCFLIWAQMAVGLLGKLFTGTLFYQ